MSFLFVIDYQVCRSIHFDTASQNFSICFYNYCQYFTNPTVWLVDTKKFSLSRKMPRSRQRSRNPKATTRRQRQKQHWCSHVASAGHKCQIPKPSSNILRVSTPRAPFPRSWRVWRHELTKTQGSLYRTSH